MSNVVDLSKHRMPVEKFVILALCISCRHRWIGTVESSTSLFKLQCPKCDEQNSFASFIPPEYLRASEH